MKSSTIYVQMTETELRTYGLGTGRIAFVTKLLRKRCYLGLQALVSVLYFLLIGAELICHDVWFVELSERAVTKVGGDIEDSADLDTVMRAFLIANGALLLIFALDTFANTVGYGQLFFCRLARLKTLLLLVSAGLLVAIAYYEKMLFGALLLSSFCLAAIRLEYMRKNSVLFKNDIQRVQPDVGVSASKEEPAKPGHGKATIISVREKVIQELKQVQERIKNDA